MRFYLGRDGEDFTLDVEPLQAKIANKVTMGKINIALSPGDVMSDDRLKELLDEAQAKIDSKQVVFTDGKFVFLNEPLEKDNKL